MYIVHVCRARATCMCMYQIVHVRCEGVHLVCLVCVLRVLFVWSVYCVSCLSGLGVICLVCLGCLSFLPTSYTASVLYQHVFQCMLFCAGRSKTMTGFATSRLDSKIKTLLSHRTQLIGELHKTGNSVTPPHLPDDC